MKRTLLFLVFFLLAATQIMRGQVTVAPTDNLQNLVNANPAGTTFTLLPGIHHDSVTSLKNGDTFTGQPGAIENGAKLLTGWSQVTINSVTYWTTGGGTPLSTGYTNVNCASGFPGCYLPQDLYLDSLTYTHVTNLSGVSLGKWYYEYQGITAATITTGGSGYVVGDTLTVSGGTGGKVQVTSVSLGSVTGISTIAVGSAYPTSSTTETTTGGTGTGCTVTVTGGSGGVTNNIYLANSENPNSHTVELGTLVYFFHSTSAQNITIRGLTIEKYAGDIDHAVVSPCHIGATWCTVSGWVIQNNEIRLSRMSGITSADYAGNIQILNNVIHHNGQFGIAGGAASNVTISGNQIYANNTDNIKQGYGAGGIKLGGTVSGILVQSNIVHDDNGHGLWSDVDSQNVTFDHNTIYNENSIGIHVEVSNHQTVTNNTVYGNGGAQIQVDSSSNVLLQYNTITVTTPSGSAIYVTYNSSRDSEHPDFTFPTVVSIVNNTISIGSSGQWATQVTDVSGTAGKWEVPGMFNLNTYCVPSLPWTAKSWVWGVGNPALNWTTWQSNGQSPTGTLTLSPCSAPATQQVLISGPVLIRGPVVAK
jgi:parallel beta-helix repeat protein